MISPVSLGLAELHANERLFQHRHAVALVAGDHAVLVRFGVQFDEALHLENALAHLKTERRVVLMHYAPIEATCEGERREIFPYLGCSRLEEPMIRVPVDVVFHGHAHKGTLSGHTTSGIPVFNVAMPLLVGSGASVPYMLWEL